MTKPIDILPTLHLLKAALQLELFTKEEIIKWADNIILEDENPDIFFTELSMLNSKSTDDALYYFTEYLRVEKPIIEGRPLLGILHNKFVRGQIDLEDTISKLYQLIECCKFTERERCYIYILDNDFDYSIQTKYLTVESIEKNLLEFLSFYKGFTIDNFTEWNELNLLTDKLIVKDWEPKIKID